MAIYIEKFEADGKRDYTKKVVGDIEDGGDLNCPIREIAAAINPTGKGDVIPTGICTNDCLFWHAGCPFLPQTKTEINGAGQERNILIFRSPADIFPEKGGDKENGVGD